MLNVHHSVNGQSSVVLSGFDLKRKIFPVKLCGTVINADGIRRSLIDYWNLGNQKKQKSPPLQQVDKAEREGVFH